jgi:hypothetical protein
MLAISTMGPVNTGIELAHCCAGEVVKDKQLGLAHKHARSSRALDLPAGKPQPTCADDRL